MKASESVRCVRSVLTAGADEIIVVDGGSRDTTRDIARAGGARVVSAAKGRALQMNAGAANARGDILLFLHADCEIRPKALDQIRRAMDSQTVDFGSFRQQIMAKGWLYRAIEFGNDLRARTLRLPYGDQGIFVRREVFDALGGFPAYRLMEDIIFSDRLRKRHRSVHLQGPIRVSARRWQQRGPIRQTFLNLALATAWRNWCPPRSPRQVLS